MAKRISEQGNAPGERTDRAGLCKAHKARLCELERNPRQPTTNPLPQAEKAKNVEQKALIGLQRYKQPKANPRWGTKSMY